MGWLERKRLERLPRFAHTHSTLLGKQIEITDPYWYLHCYQEIFLEQIYRFRSLRTDPLVIDCGSNIGMSVIYFKYLYPEARIIAFEPDAEVFPILKRNMATFQLSDVELHQRAVWHCEGEMSFLPDGSVGGRLLPGEEIPRATRVRTVRLNDFLHDTVDFLKLDIEGAEYEVLANCREELRMVRCLFVEYHGKRNEGQLLHKILQMIHDAGFRYHVKDANPIKHPFLGEERRRLYDLQLNLFGFRD